MKRRGDGHKKAAILVMIDEKPNLTIGQVAKILGVSVSYASEIKTNSGMTLPDGRRRQYCMPHIQKVN